MKGQEDWLVWTPAFYLWRLIFQIWKTHSTTLAVRFIEYEMCGGGKAKRAEPIGFALIFSLLLSFVSRQKKVEQKNGALIYFIGFNVETG